MPKQSTADGSIKDKVTEVAAKAALPIRSVAEEAAQQAKQLHLQSLRDKVAKAKSASSSAEADEKKAEAGSTAQDKPAEAAAAASEKSLASVVTPASSAQHIGAGLQSPTTGAWKGELASLDDAAVLRTVQSPTTTSWKPTDFDPPATSFMGSKVTNASAEEIRAVEEEQTIWEEDEEDDEEETPETKA